MAQPQETPQVDGNLEIVDLQVGEDIQLGEGWDNDEDWDIEILFEDDDSELAADTEATVIPDMYAELDSAVAEKLRAGDARKAERSRKTAAAITSVTNTIGAAFNKATGGLQRYMADAPQRQHDRRISSAETQVKVDVAIIKGREMATNLRNEAVNIAHELYEFAVDAGDKTVKTAKSYREAARKANKAGAARVGLRVRQLAVTAAAAPLTAANAVIAPPTFLGQLGPRLFQGASAVDTARYNRLAEQADTNLNANPNLGEATGFENITNEYKKDLKELVTNGDASLATKAMLRALELTTKSADQITIRVEAAKRRPAELRRKAEESRTRSANYNRISNALAAAGFVVPGAAATMIAFDGIRRNAAKQDIKSARADFRSDLKYIWS